MSQHCKNGLFFTCDLSGFVHGHDVDVLHAARAHSTRTVQSNALAAGLPETNSGEVLRFYLVSPNPPVSPSKLLKHN